MKKRERCRGPVFFAMCISMMFLLCGCSRGAVYRFETPDQTAAGSASSTPDGSGPGAGDAGQSAETVQAESTEPETIWVYVCGAVKVPGVYELSAGGRVYQALEAAGGALEGAELRSLNQAALLTDGEQITVYTVEETAGAGGVPSPVAGAQAGSGRINLNTASKDELMKLSGIGEARAQAIINYRETHGPFTAIEEVMNIEGIKEKAFSKIKDEIEV